MKHGIPELTKTDGTLTSGDKDKTDVLATFFSSVFTIEPDTDIASKPPFCDNQISECAINQDIVKKKLKDIKISKSPGPDNIHPRVLYELIYMTSLMYH